MASKKKPPAAKVWATRKSGKPEPGSHGEGQARSASAQGPLAVAVLKAKSATAMAKVASDAWSKNAKAKHAEARDQNRETARVAREHDNEDVAREHDKTAADHDDYVRDESGRFASK